MEQQLKRKEKFSTWKNNNSNYFSSKWKDNKKDENFWSKSKDSKKNKKDSKDPKDFKKSNSNPFTSNPKGRIQTLNASSA